MRVYKNRNDDNQRRNHFQQNNSTRQFKRTNIPTKPSPPMKFDNTYGVSDLNQQKTTQLKSEYEEDNNDYEWEGIIIGGPVAMISSGVRVKVIEKNGNLLKVVYNGKTAYVPERHVKRVSSHYNIEGIDDEEFNKNILVAVKAIKDISFGRKNRTIYNKKYWHTPNVEPDPKKQTNKSDDLVIKAGILPSIALKDIFDNPKNYTIDCGETSELITLYALLLTVGSSKFDKYITSKGQPFTLKYVGTVGATIKDEYSPTRDGHLVSDADISTTEYQTFESLIIKGVSVDEKLKSIPIGSKITLFNDRVEDGNAFQSENIVKVGENRWAAIGLGGGHSINIYNSFDKAFSNYAEYTRMGLTLEDSKKHIFVNSIVTYDFSDL